VKNHIDQSHDFELCALGLAWPILTLLQRQKFLEAGLLAIVALGFIANMAFVNLSRTVLVTLPVILVIVTLHRMSWRAVLVALSVLGILGSLSWTVSPALRAKTASLLPPYRLYEPENTPSSIEMRSEYWRKSLAFVREAPLIGHGTGSIRRLFERAATNQTGLAAEVTSNPHNQILYAAVQWGLVGVLALYAMWVSHLTLFRRSGWEGWVGFLIVVQNAVSSLFNSHLADFQEGWIYVLGVGVTGGMVLRAKLQPLTTIAPCRTL
jgi:O-antigen ligase